MAIFKMDGVDGVVAYPKKFVTLYATEIITKGNVVAIDEDVSTNGAGLHVCLPDAADTINAIGVAAETVASGATIRVQVAGYNEDTTHDATMALAAPGRLVGTTTAGLTQELTAVNITSRAFAICVTAFGSTTNGAIMIFDHGFYG